MKPILETKQLNKTYQTGDVTVSALRGIDLTVKQGEFIVLLGPSGSGKSTLLNIMGGLDSATSGQIFYHDQDISSKSDAQLNEYRREHVGFVFQFYNLISNLTAIENIEIVTEIATSPMDAEQALSLVDLTPQKNSFPSQLSGGQQQRVSIARAVAKQPKLLFCDEPTGALDSQTGSKVLEAICSINEKIGTTTLIITHNADIAHLADRVLFLHDGEIVEEKTNTTKKHPKDLKW